MAERGSVQRLTRRIFLYPLQGLFIGLLFLICRYIPITWASALGSWVFRVVGPHLRADKVARRNLKNCYPDMTQADIDRTVRAVWDNLGRGAGEWGQVDLIPTMGPNSRVEIVGEEIMNKAIADGGHDEECEAGDHGQRRGAAYRDDPKGGKLTAPERFLHEVPREPGGDQ